MSKYPQLLNSNMSEKPERPASVSLYLLQPLRTRQQVEYDIAQYEKSKRLPDDWRENSRSRRERLRGR